MKTYYMGIEPLESRYTHQLQAWNEEAFQLNGVPLIPIYGTMPAQLEGKIVTGSVLDAHGRTHYSLTQTAALVSLLQQGTITSDDVIFYEDMFTPGIESLPYIFRQTPAKYRPKVFVRCLAQSIDPDDFVNREGMFDFMRRYEQVVDSFVDGILVASEEMVAHLRIAGFKAPIYVTGLPFGKREVQSRVTPKAFEERPMQVAFAARWDDEKQPKFFLNVVKCTQEIAKEVGVSPIKFVVLTGSPTLRSNNPELLDLAWVAAADPTMHFDVHFGLSKNQYYEHLANSRVLFNCALQDWVSNTVSEADALGTQTLYPAYRSFPETFGNDARHMYIPWSVEDASRRLLQLVQGCVQDLGRVSDYQDGTIRRTIEVFRAAMYPELPGSEVVLRGQGRNTLDYRKHVAK